MLLLIHECDVFKVYFTLVFFSWTDVIYVLLTCYILIEWLRCAGLNTWADPDGRAKSAREHIERQLFYITTTHTAVIVLRVKLYKRALVYPTTL